MMMDREGSVITTVAQGLFIIYPAAALDRGAR